MKKLSKVLSVGLSLALCGSMVAPSFAASFTDLQNAIDSNGGTQIGDTDRYGYGWNETEKRWGIEAWDEDDTRNILLNENVEYDKEGGDKDRGPTLDKYYTNKHWGDYYGIEIMSKDVNIDLNGKAIDLNPDTVLDAKTGIFYEAEKDEDGNVIRDESGNKIATDTEVSRDSLNRGCVIMVTRFAGKPATSVTITDSSAETYVDEEGNTHYVAGTGTGAITGGYICDDGGLALGNNKEATLYWQYQAAGVSVARSSTFIMNGGSITGNLSEGVHGGIAASGPLNGCPGINDVRLNGVTISNNHSEDRAGGVDSIYSISYVEIKDSVIRDNYGKGTGGYSRSYDPNSTDKGYGHITVENTAVCNNYNIRGQEAPRHAAGDWEVVTPAAPGVAGLEELHCKGCGELLDSREIPALPVIPAITTPDDNEPTTPTTGRIPGERPAGGETEAEAEATIGIEDEAVPLAGLFTRADAIGYLWEKSGSPEAELSDFPDVPEDHEWAVAIGWAQANGIALADADGNFRPDDLVLRSTDDVEGELQEFLNRYAVFAGVELDEDELFIELDGEPDDIIMGEDAQEIFDGFFARLEEALADIAA